MNITYNQFNQKFVLYDLETNLHVFAKGAGSGTKFTGRCSSTAMLFAKFQNNSATDMYGMGKQDFVILEFQHDILHGNSPCLFLSVCIPNTDTISIHNTGDITPSMLWGKRSKTSPLMLSGKLLHHESLKTAHYYDMQMRCIEWEWFAIPVPLPLP